MTYFSFSSTSSGFSSPIPRKAEEISVSSEVVYPQEVNNDLNCWNLDLIPSIGTFMMASIEAASLDLVRCLNWENRLMGYVPSNLRPAMIVAATPADCSFGTP